MTGNTMTGNTLFETSDHEELLSGIGTPGEETSLYDDIPEFGGMLGDPSSGVPTFQSKPPFAAPRTGVPAEPSDRDIAELDEGPYSIRRVMEETIAELRQTLEQREQELLTSTIAAANFQQELTKVQTRNEHLRKKLTTVVKAQEAMNQKVAAAEQSASTQGRTVSEAEVAQMKEQWRVAQKAFEREYGRVKSELAKTKAGAHQVSQELETQTRARRAEAAHASLRIANLEREVEAARAPSARGAGVDREKVWLKLSATAAATAIAMLVLGFWWQMGHSGTGGDAGRPAAAEAAREQGSRPGPLVPSSLAKSPSPSSQVPSSQSPSTQVPSGGGTLSPGLVSRGAFQKSLSRLNNVLYGPVGVTPEQILRAVRESNAKTNPNVCNFQWNNGQPALYFGGAQTSLGESLDQCATAVEGFLRQPDVRTVITRK